MIQIGLDAKSAEHALQLLKRDELGGDRLHLLARRRVAVGPARQLVDRADQRLARLTQAQVVMPEFVMDEIGDRQIEAEFRPVIRQIEEIALTI